MDGSLAYLVGASAENHIQEMIRAEERHAHAVELQDLANRYQARLTALTHEYNQLAENYNALHAQLTHRVNEYNQLVTNYKVTYDALTELTNTHNALVKKYNALL